jgi:uncharacterized protein (DUF2141 family)
MNRLVLAAAAIAGMALAAAPPARAQPSVALTVTDIASPPQGFLMIALHNEKGWSGAPLARLRVAVTAATMTVTLAAPAPGRYGIKLYHDVDGDGKLATNIVGFPTEPVGFSNGARIVLGSPAFSEAAFEVGPGATAHRISLK